MKEAYSTGIVTLFDEEVKHQKLLYKYVLAMGIKEERCCLQAAITMQMPRKVLVQYCKKKKLIKS